MIWLYLTVLLGTFVLMEVVAWFTHKYLMHGPLWILHKDHHKRTNSRFEWNDLFTVIFATIAVFFWFMGIPEFNIYFWIAAGITGYGISYFLAHDVLVHQRIKLFGKVKSPYLKALQKAHRAHHSKVTKNNGKSFGFLWVGRKYFN